MRSAATTMPTRKREKTRESARGRWRKLCQSVAVAPDVQNPGSCATVPLGVEVVRFFTGRL